MWGCRRICLHQAHGWHESRARAASPGLHHLLRGERNWSWGRSGCFETVPVSFERILREAQEFGRAVAAWMYFLIGEREKKKAIRSANLIS